MKWRVRINPHLKIFIVTFIFFLMITDVNELFCQNANTFTWIAGDNIGEQLGVYGEQGIPDIANKPSCRREAMCWTDNEGNLWLFGGFGKDSTGTGGYLNDMWKFDITLGQWAWMAGSKIIDQREYHDFIGGTSPLNNPGGRKSSVTWRDNEGNLWLFGGHCRYIRNEAGNKKTTYVSDIWKFEISVNCWAMIKTSSPYGRGIYGEKGVPSSSNFPGFRSFAMGWNDYNGNLWLFGGIGFDENQSTGSLNDLWKFDIESHNWTWIGGEKSKNQLGEYGTMGVPYSNNIPGGRSQAIGWRDKFGNFWLFGGDGFATSDDAFWPRTLSDLWKYDIVTGYWTWIKGDDVVFEDGVYGSKGVPSSSNKPGNRRSAASWTDNNGDFWLFGGWTVAPLNHHGYLNDLWKYDFNSGDWVWMGGDDVQNQSGEYGSKGVPGTNTKPGSRHKLVNWTDLNGDLWLLGGVGYDENNNYSHLNDLWKYTLDIPQRVNNAPTVEDQENYLVEYQVGSGTKKLFGSFVLNDVDDINLYSAEIKIAENYVIGEDFLRFENSSNITGSFSETDGSIILQGIDRIAKYEDAIRSIEYVNNSGLPSLNPREITVTVNDGRTKSNSYIKIINILPPQLLSPTILSAHFDCKDQVILDTLEINYDCTNNIILSWQDNSNNESGFKILRKPIASSSSFLKDYREVKYDVIGIVNADETEFIDSSTIETQLYCYKVIAYNEIGSTHSLFVEDNIIEIETPLNTPTELTIIKDRKGLGNYLKWRDNSAFEEGYEVFKIDGDHFYYIGYVSQNDTLYKLIYEPRVKFSYLVKPYSNNFETLFSDIVVLFKPVIDGIDDMEISYKYSLAQNYPNPFNPSTAINFTIPEISDVSIIIYDLLGREVIKILNEEKLAGNHIIYWNGKNKNSTMVSSGIYFYKIEAGSFTEIKKMVFMK